MVCRPVHCIRRCLCGTLYDIRFRLIELVRHIGYLGGERYHMAEEFDSRLWGQSQDMDALHQEIARILCLFRRGKEMPQVSRVLPLMLRPVDGVFVILFLSRYDMVGDLIGSIRVLL